VRDGRAGRIVLALLGVDGALSALAGALLLPSYIGAVPLPVSALLSGVLNVALVWAAGRWTTSKSLAALPLWTWLATVTVLTLGGPGGDVVFGGPGVMAYSVFVLLIAGGLPPVLMLRRMRRLTA
jgi:hypothetical protein